MQAITTTTREFSVSEREEIVIEIMSEDPEEWAEFTPEVRAYLRATKPLFPVSAVDLIKPFVEATTDDQHSIKTQVSYRDADDLAEQIAKFIFPSTLNPQRREALEWLLKAFAAEIKRSAIEP
jgi:hypothetical protein